LNRAAIRSNLYIFARIGGEIPIDGESPSEQVTEALEHSPNWFTELSKNRRRAIVRILEFTGVAAISYNDFDYELTVLGW
jgi:hypothetical protein